MSELYSDQLRPPHFLHVTHEPDSALNGKGVGMTKFEKPGRRKGYDYPEFALEAGTKALIDANLTYDDVEFAAVGYTVGDSTCGQRALYQLGMTQIPVINCQNACATGSSALTLARQAVESGLYDCTMALGFEKMYPGTIREYWTDRVASGGYRTEAIKETRGWDPKAPRTAQQFGAAGIEYCEKFGAEPIHMGMIAEKNHRHSALNPYSQFQDVHTLDQVMKSRTIFGPLTVLQCCPTSDGAGAAILCSESFVLKHNLAPQAVLIAAQAMATDSFQHVETKSGIDMAGAEMTRKAVQEATRVAGVKIDDVQVVELHDCFSANELITYDALGLSAPGKAHELIASGNATYGGKYVVNPSGGLISKGHPLGATGLAQCAELCWQVRGWCGKRQVKNVKYAMQHNVGLAAGVCVVAIYTKATFANGEEKDTSKWQDPRERFGYNPATEARLVTRADIAKVVSKKGALPPGKVFESGAAGARLPSPLSPAALAFVADSLAAPPHTFSPTPHQDSLLAPILISRAPGSDGSKKVRKYMSDILAQHGWAVEEHWSLAATPQGQTDVFNVVATWRANGLPDHAAKLVLGAHYDSKILHTRPPFIGATDAATSVAILLHLSRRLPQYLERLSRSTSSAFSTTPTTVSLVFFDAEESVEGWSDSDGLYGSRALAHLWATTGELERISLLCVMDLLAARGEDDTILCYDETTWPVWDHMRSVESRLRNVRAINTPALARRASFPPGPFETVAGFPIDDDHQPFANRGVPCVHVCPVEFPKVWHTARDNAGAVDQGKCAAWAEVLGTWLVEALGLGGRE
ncbi:sterol carrier protein 2 [Gonapodya sp. JEL0774]|nr:sterol carrier protein 2 [Gonapodya sp. JEL0774]